MKRILYVEDNEDTADAVKIILQKIGFEVQVESCGKDALNKAHEQFDLILLDIMLPDMSGWDIFEKLVRRKVKTKYAFLSAIPVSNERLMELRKAGIADYIMKPFDKEDLINRIKKILE